MLRLIFFMIIIISTVFSKDTRYGLAYSPGIMEFEEWDGDIDFNTISFKYADSMSSSSEWGVFYELDTEEGDFEILSSYVRSYLQNDVFRPFLELDVGVILGDGDTEPFIGGKLGGLYKIDESNAVEVSLRYMIFATDYQEYYVTSINLGYLFSI